MLRLRRAHRLNQMDMARKLKITQPTICKIEAGKNPSLPVFLRAARMLHSTSVSDSLYEEFNDYIFNDSIWRNPC